MIKTYSFVFAGVTIRKDLKFLEDKGLIFFGFSISNLTEAYINQKMINASQVVVVLADSSKFGRRGIGKIGELEQVQYIVTDRGGCRLVPPPH